MRLARFTPAQRLFHLLLLLSFLVQSATGLARLYAETAWGRSLGRVFGGQEGCLATHKAVGVFMILLFAAHLAYVAVLVIRKGAGRTLLGPDSLLPRLSDGGQFLRHLGWMFGLAEAPAFDRWAYWEKFDYWAVFWGMVIIGGTGLILLDPLASSRVMPGWSLNVALWVHRIEAILAMGHVFLIHFTVAHLRPASFPMDRAMFDGAVGLEHARSERPLWLERLRSEGRLDGALAPERPAAFRAVSLVFGWLAVAAGVYLLVAGLVNAPLVTW